MTEEGQSIGKLETILVASNGRRKILLVGGGVAVPRRFNILSLRLCRVEEAFNILIGHLAVDIRSLSGGS